MQSVLVRLTDVCMGEAANGSQDIQMPVSTQKPVSSHTDPKPNKEGSSVGSCSQDSSSHTPDVAGKREGTR